MSGTKWNAGPVGHLLRSSSVCQYLLLRLVCAARDESRRAKQVPFALKAPLGRLHHWLSPRCSLLCLWRANSASSASTIAPIFATFPNVDRSASFVPIARPALFRRHRSRFRSVDFRTHARLQSGTEAPAWLEMTDSRENQVRLAAHIQVGLCPTVQ